MVQKSHGKMHRTRRKIRASEDAGITKYLASFKTGDRVLIKLSASSTFPHPKFEGNTGIVEDKVGRSYKIRVKNMNKEKFITLKPEHIRKLGEK